MKVATNCVICGSESLNIKRAVFYPFVMHRIFHWAPVVMKFSDDQSMLALPICNTIQCTRCGFVFCDVRFDDEEMAKLYKDYRGASYVELREAYEPGYSQLNAELENETVPYYAEMERFILDALPARPRRVLDWGGNNGINTPFRDAEIEIFDIGAKAPKYGRLVTEPTPPYDLIVCSNVLEHVSYPRWLMMNVKACMDKDTRLYLEVPVENLDMTFWHEHINRFNEQSMEKLAEVCGLEIVKMQRFPPPKHGYINLLFVVCKLKATE